RVMRGGSWNNDARNLRCANRNNDRPSNRNNNLGFRLCQHNFLPGVKRPRLFYRCIKLSIKMSLSCSC
ncbi:MAG: SUMF1/EgtB/PvdO family nonheme iron enzyme, partial [Candidatus Aminicenantes bacterium]|nr:SUMF1/EgtB/PvdO family nonheme iron enzyme [Candidatus Aminicenantes bacterium]NIM82707.1 SUMF1/EgtB/PvdO family nonheme iron enzyme [Candidatus Aminicenantes bacterium]NIN22079.1 SUMF1/EgtB/PvdO family nonheme iron enzyme [Candidatus Aminicenantes bacterium]NIN45838.1 SUMF1/EgtB/PvdO family nonheme iron enzyme [Candidatus Aminicenantes bacterium]NIN88675.1 SUMF1/EgtB/PvdO family nonheme iron enzyme [Candidatus Aminicenantes bacterium]